ncbi:MAG: aldolase/citrate lyase family protein [Gammaproteobacteria bacterium]|nr:aldolase/citrate lyase family protein [Gammaproteobacteria bacterium]
MRKNHVLAAWREDKQTVGGWLSMDSALSAEMMANTGFDWLCIDLQHGMLDYSDLKIMLPAISTTSTIPFVRVPWNEPYEIMKALDAGAYGVIVPLINNREEAEKAVSACRYPPDGLRSLGPVRAAIYGGPGYIQEANNEIACIVMIETAEALDNLDEILSTPGVDAVYIGPSDLAYAIGLSPTGDNNDPKHVATVNRIFEACKKHNIAAGIHTGSLEYTKRYLNQGFNLVTLGTDSGFMARLAHRELRAAREDTGTDRVDAII